MLVQFLQQLKSEETFHSIYIPYTHILWSTATVTIKLRSRFNYQSTLLAFTGIVNILYKTFPLAFVFNIFKVLFHA